MVAALCRSVATADPGSEIEIAIDARTPRYFLPIDECLDEIERLMCSDGATPVTLGSYAMTVNQLARLIMEVSGKALRIRNRTCRRSRGRSVERGTRLGWGPNSPLAVSLRCTYLWIEAQVPRAPARAPDRSPDREQAPALPANGNGRARDTLLLERVREAVQGRELIDWADTKFGSLWTNSTSSVCKISLR